MRAELLRLLHQTLDSMGVDGDNIHMLVEWIDDEDDATRKEHEAEIADARDILEESRRTWMLRTVGMFAIGLALGLVLGWRFGW